MMEDELFADLLASAEEMVKIEQGEITPKPEHVYTFESWVSATDKKFPGECETKES